MYHALLSFHWKVARMPLLLTAVATFTVPLLSVQRWEWDLGNWSDAAMMLAMMQGFAVLYPLLAAVAGLLLAVTAWSKDHRGSHVYALTLPLDRWNGDVRRAPPCTMHC